MCGEKKLAFILTEKVDTPDDKPWGAITAQGFHKEVDSLKSLVTSVLNWDHTARLNVEVFNLFSQRATKLYRDDRMAPRMSLEGHKLTTNSMLAID